MDPDVDRAVGVALLVVAATLSFPLVRTSPAVTTRWLFDRTAHEWYRAVQAADAGDLQATRAALLEVSEREESPGALAALGDVEVRLGDLSAAEQHLRSATAGDDADPLAMARLGDVRYRRGERPDAIRIWQVAKAAGVSGPVAERLTRDARAARLELAVAAYNKGVEFYRGGAVVAARDAWLEASSHDRKGKVGGMARTNIRSIKRKRIERLRKRKLLAPPSPAPEADAPGEVTAMLRALAPVPRGDPNEPGAAWGVALLAAAAGVGFGGRALRRLHRRPSVIRKKRRPSLAVIGCAAVGGVLAASLWQWVGWWAGLLAAGAFFGPLALL